jgi:GPH family glycoside/pentoside/hexuronide:cation symporter
MDERVLPASARVTERVAPFPRPAATPVLYGAPIVGLSYLLFFVQFYFLKYATDVLLLSPALIGTLFAGAKLWDGLSDPLFGSWSDRSRFRLGRRRPFLVAALPFLAAGFWMIFAAPASLSGSWLFAWVSVALFVFFTGYTAYTIPHAALGAEISDDIHERTRLFAARQMSFTVGMLAAFGGIQLAMNAADPRAMAGKLSFWSALVAVLLLVVTPLTVREPERGHASGGQDLRSGLRDVWRTRPARILFLVSFVENLGVGAVGTMAPYVAEYLLRRPDVVGTLPAAYVISAVISIPIWVLLSRRFGNRNTWLSAMLLAAVAFGGMWFVGPGDLGLAIALLVLAGIAMGCGGVLASAILAQVIDVDARRTGERKEGIYSAALALVNKVGLAGATAVSGIVLAAVEFVPNAQQAPETLLGIRWLFGGMPCVGFLCGAFLFRRFSLDEERPKAP